MIRGSNKAYSMFMHGENVVRLLIIKATMPFKVNGSAFFDLLYICSSIGGISECDDM